jgi:hypothetical protein
MPSLSQKPGGCKENDPQQGVFGCLHDPYRCLCKQISHTNRVTDSSRDEDQDETAKKGHPINPLIKKDPKPLLESHNFSHFLPVPFKFQHPLLNRRFPSILGRE